MSLIADALKTAQREKSRRDSPDDRETAVPLLVPLRTKPQSGFKWPRTLLLAGAILATLVAVWILRQGRRKTPYLPTIPAVTSTILSEAIAADTASIPTTGARVSRLAPSASSRVSSRAPSAAPPRATKSAPPIAARATATAAVKPGTSPGTSPGMSPGMSAILQVRTPDSVGAPSGLALGPQSPGTLRISVEQPRQADAGRLFAEAIAAHRAGDFATARALYERVLFIVPNDADALNNLGVLLSGQREFDRALELLRRAASLAPRNAGVWNNIGAALREQGKSSDAILAFRHALTIEPQHQGARVGLAQQYIAIGALPQAKELLDAVLAANPALAEAQYTLGQLLELQGDRDGAVRAYSAFVRIAPPRLASHVELVRRHIDALRSRAP